MRNKRKTGEVMMIGPRLFVIIYHCKPAYFLPQLNCNNFLYYMYRETRKLCNVFSYYYFSFYF